MIDMRLNTVSEHQSEPEDLLTILAPVYTSGLAVQEYKRTLLYLSSLALKDVKNKKKIMKNWTFPYIEALLLFLDKLENNKELMKESQYFINTKNSDTY
jgi:hypothetical protein